MRAIVLDWAIHRQSADNAPWPKHVQINKARRASMYCWLSGMCKTEFFM